MSWMFEFSYKFYLAQNLQEKKEEISDRVPHTRFCLNYASTRIGNV